jgi:hypothetical protein
MVSEQPPIVSMGRDWSAVVRLRDQVREVGPRQSGNPTLRVDRSRVRPMQSGMCFGWCRNRALLASLGDRFDGDQRSRAWAGLFWDQLAAEE